MTTIVHLYPDLKFRIFRSSSTPDTVPLERAYGAGCFLMLVTSAVVWLAGWSEILDDDELFEYCVMLV